MNAPQITWLPDRQRLHLNHGPIDLILQAFGPDREKQRSYEAAVSRFHNLLNELVIELDHLRSDRNHNYRGLTAIRMARAVAPHGDTCFITPMAAVAGAVADTICEVMADAADLDRASVNNGGDIAFHLGNGAEFSATIAGHSVGTNLIRLCSEDPVRGIATSGWRGRSQSRGIADAVTVLARTSAAADAAATLIANAVDIPGHPAISRRPACDIKADSDLGHRLVTVSVGRLSDSDTNIALSRGAKTATDMLQRDLIGTAALYLNGHVRIVGPLWPVPVAVNADATARTQNQHAGRIKTA